MGKRHTTSTPRPKGTLQAKILSGYLLLTLLVGGIVYAVWYEKQVFQKAEEEERSMLEQRRLTNSAFKSLIALLLYSDGALLWDGEDLRSYEEKDSRMSEMLARLSAAYPDSLQRSRIDTVRMLLARKKAQIFRLAETPSTASRMDSLLSERLPPLEHSASVPGRVADLPEDEGGKKSKRGFWDWLKPKKKKAKDGNGGKREAPAVRVVPNTRHVRDMRQFRDDVFAALREQKEMYRALSDSLERRNRVLNRHINRLVNDFERDAMLRTEERLERVSALREEAFALICGISSAGLLCALLLYVFIYRDIRGKYRDRRVLEAAHRKGHELLEIRKRIIVTLSHDIRGPLNAISGSAELAMDTKDRKRRNAYLENILESSRHIARLANNLLDLSRLDEAKETLNPVPFRLDSFLDRIVEEYTHTANSKGLLFSERRSGTGVTVRGDADRIEQIADNLLSNAVKFTGAGEITLEAIYGDGSLRLRVSDTGIGMDGDTVRRIFAPFERAAPDTNAEGFGLGLSITQGLVHLLGGDISVESSPGAGSTFTAVFPLAETDEPAEEPPVPSGMEGRLPRRVLVVDDNPVQLSITGEMLERNGIRCRTCRTVKEVVHELRHGEFDLLLTDIQMPGTSGFDLLRLLRQSHIGSSRTLPVAAMTARSDTDDAGYLKAGFAGCIRKPFSSPELLAFLSSVAWQAEGARTDVPPTADFASLTAEVGDKRKLLEMFIEESRRNAAALREALARPDRRKLRETVHRMYPMWELLHIEDELAAYRKTLHDAEAGREKITGETERLIGRVGSLIAEARAVIKRMEDEKEDTDS